MVNKAYLSVFILSILILSILSLSVSATLVDFVGFNPGNSVNFVDSSGGNWRVSYESCEYGIARFNVLQNSTGSNLILSKYITPQSGDYSVTSELGFNGSSIFAKITKVNNCTLSVNVGDVYSEVNSGSSITKKNYYVETGAESTGGDGKLGGDIAYVFDKYFIFNMSDTIDVIAGETTQIPINFRGSEVLRPTLYISGILPSWYSLPSIWEGAMRNKDFEGYMKECRNCTTGFQYIDFHVPNGTRIGKHYFTIIADYDSSSYPWTVIEMNITLNVLDSSSIVRVENVSANESERIYTETLDTLLKLENLEISIISINKTSKKYADYYATINNTNKVNKWKKVLSIIGNISVSIENTKGNLRSRIETNNDKYKELAVYELKNIRKLVREIIMTLLEGK